MYTSFSDNNNTGTRITYPRWYFRKRFWTVPRKTVYVTPTATDSQNASSNVSGGFAVNSVENGNVVATSKIYTGSLFDDIFNVS